jgi:hypothetical protein
MADKIATSQVVPPACPACGFVFATQDNATMTSHFLGHMVMQMGAGTSRESTADW